MKCQTLMGVMALSVMAALAAPIASADCDITDTKCYINSGKCNIKFRNVTGKKKGSGGGTKLSQQSLAQQIRVKAIDDDAKAAGNILNIEAASSKTMNIDKKYKKDFAQIRISAPFFDTVNGVTMSCADVKAVLNGNGTCKVFNGATKYQKTYLRSQLGYNCNSGAVVGPK